MYFSVKVNENEILKKIEEFAKCADELSRKAYELRTAIEAEDATETVSDSRAEAAESDTCCDDAGN